MKIYALGDLHLSFSSNPDPPFWTADQYKPMSELDLFWQDHSRKIYENWQKLVGPEDVVLVPGDISWAMRLEDVQADIAYLGLLPGKIILIQGNHDYWWQSISRVRKLLPANISAIQNDCVLVGNMAICGTRGWSIPGSVCFEESRDMRIYLREINRLENSLKCAVSQNVEKIIVMMHFMPCNEKRELSGFIELFIKYQVETVVYGHLHSKGCRCRLPEKHWGINFFLASADYLGFTPVLVDSY